MASFGIEARLNATTGTPDDWRAAVDEWRALGATHLSVNTMGAGLQTPDAHVERVRQALQVIRG